MLITDVFKNKRPYKGRRVRTVSPQIVDDIESGKLQVELEKIDVPHWFKNHCMGDVNEDHMPSVVLSKPVIQAEIKAGFFEIIDGRHRMEKALRENLQYIDSYRLKGECLNPLLFGHFFQKGLT